MLSSIGECARVGAIHPSWVGYGHMPPRWSSEWHTEQLKIFVILPAPLESVMNMILWIKFFHSQSELWSFVGGNM